MRPVLRRQWSRAGVRPPRRALTLVELVVTVAIMSVLMGGLASAILIASHALPNEQRLSSGTARSAEAANQIVDELRMATWFVNRSATLVEFTVADRDDDGVPERVRYEWSGSAGDPLTRQYNGGSIIDVLEHVHEFHLTYALKSVSEEYSGPVVEGAEAELSSHGHVYDEFKYFPIKKDEWPGQYFEPALPGDAVSWRVTRVWVYVRAEAGIEQTLVQIRPADADNKPIDTVLAEEVMDEGDLEDSYTWHEVSFTNAGGLSPNQGFCLVLENGSGGGVSARLAYDDGGGSGGVNTKDGGKTWSFYDWIARLYYVYGTASTPTPPQTATRYYVTGVQVTLQTGDDPASRLVTTAQTLNSPELLSGLWETDFGSDPTPDHNGDGLDDWAVEGGGSFNENDLADGAWQPGAGDPQLETNPPNDFTGLTTVELRFRNTSIGGQGAGFGINVDWAGPNCAGLLAFLQLQSDNTQTLRVEQRLDAIDTQTLVTVAGLSDGFVDLRLLIDPTLNTVNVRVDATDYGTFVYTHHLPAASEHFAAIGPTGSDAEFDYVSIRASE